MSRKRDQQPAIILLMGATGTGKTTFINHASNAGLTIGHQLQSCTTDVQTTPPFLVDGKSVILVDTPGFDDTDRSNTDILHTIVTYLATSYKEGQKLAGVLYFHRISDPRMGGVSRRNFELLRQLCGKDALKNVTIVTNMWSKVTPQEGADRERELKTDERYFALAIQAGAQMARHDGNAQSATNILRPMVNNVPQTLQIQKELFEDRLAIGDTAAGKALMEDLFVQERQHQKETDEMRQEMQHASSAGKQELQSQIEEQDAEVKKIQAELARLRDNPPSPPPTKVRPSTPKPRPNILVRFRSALTALFSRKSSRKDTR